MTANSARGCYGIHPTPELYKSLGRVPPEFTRCRRIFLLARVTFSNSAGISGKGGNLRTGIKLYINIYKYIRLIRSGRPLSMQKDTGKALREYYRNVSGYLQTDLS